ncbi:hypothetical protein BASA61_006123 [Batrachochytrium salamandrivorans]|nr:hypothetical protein BASA61_006123 [Batrachochytrium salamandrivorans]
MKLSYIGAASALLALASAGPTPIPGIKKPPARGYSSENVGNCLFGPDEHDDPFGSNTDGDESPADNGCGSRNDPLTSNLDTEHGDDTAAPTPKKPNTRSLAASGYRSRFGYRTNSPSTRDRSYPQHHHKGIPNEAHNIPETSEAPEASKTPEAYDTPETPEASEAHNIPETPETPKTPETWGIFKLPDFLSFLNFFKTSETSEAPKTYKIYKVLETGETPGAFEDSEDSENFGTLEIPKTPETDRVF